MWSRRRVRSLVLDINGETWGEHALVIGDDVAFESLNWRTRGFFVVIDEASTVIARDREKTPIFTRLRHQNHQLCVIGHDGTNLTREMREQFDVINLFRVSADGAEIWAKNFAQPSLMEAPSLGQFEFLHYELYGAPPQKLKLKL
jgi:hypothetical protein